MKRVKTMGPNKASLKEKKRCPVVPMYPHVIPDSVASSAHAPSLSVPIPGYIASHSTPRTQVIVQISRKKSHSYSHKHNYKGYKMFIGRVYENRKKNKQTSNTNTYNEQASNKQSRSRGRSSGDDSDEEERTGKSEKNSANLKKSRTVVSDSPPETDPESEREEYAREPKKVSGKESGEKSFMERINDKVKKLKKDKDGKDVKVNGFSGDSKQVVYTIPPSTDVEKGVKRGKRDKSLSKDKFDSIELDSRDEKEQYSEEGGLKNVAVQATPYPPFRLRVLPHPDWQESETTLLKLVRFVVCQCGLACIVLIWALLGALVFYLTEAPREFSQVQEMNRRQTELVVGLATELRQVVPEEPVWRSTIEQYAAHHEALILSAVSSGYPQRGTVWTYCGCLLFATSLLTTLGFGAPVPRTVLGRVCAIVFAGLGIPLHLLLVLNVGLLFAVKLHHAARVSVRKVTRLRRRLNKAKEDWPEDIFEPEDTPPPPPSWIKFFPFVAIPLYYLTGLLLFGVLRNKSFPEVLLFPLDFTAAGGVASTYDPLRLAYACYLEGAVILASTNVALLRVTATRGFTALGIKLGLMINFPK